MVHEDPSTEATQKLPKERMFRKKSIVIVITLKSMSKLARCFPGRAG
ncbi:MAG: hypothetical protein LBJ16_02230 [Holosporaceae bacterium]|nr:hypothetical protein [Holosporaceae bacterium]